MSSQTQILPFTLPFCVSDSTYPEVSAAEDSKVKAASSVPVRLFKNTEGLCCLNRNASKLRGSGGPAKVSR